MAEERQKQPNLSAHHSKSWFDRETYRQKFDTKFNAMDLTLAEPSEKKKIALLGLLTYQPPRRIHELANLKITHGAPELKDADFNYLFNDGYAKMFLNVVKGSKRKKNCEKTNNTNKKNN